MRRSIALRENIADKMVVLSGQDSDPNDFSAAGKHIGKAHSQVIVRDTPVERALYLAIFGDHVERGADLTVERRLLVGLRYAGQDGVSFFDHHRVNLVSHF